MNFSFGTPKAPAAGTCIIFYYIFRTMYILHPNKSHVFYIFMILFQPQHLAALQQPALLVHLILVLQLQHLLQH